MGRDGELITRSEILVRIFDPNFQCSFRYDYDKFLWIFWNICSNYGNFFGRTKVEIFQLKEIKRNLDQLKSNGGVT